MMKICFGLIIPYPAVLLKWVQLKILCIDFVHKFVQPFTREENDCENPPPQSPGLRAGGMNPLHILRLYHRITGYGRTTGCPCGRGGRKILRHRAHFIKARIERIEIPAVQMVLEIP